MAKAFECDGCGKLIKKPAYAKASVYLSTKQHFVKVFPMHSINGEDPEDTEDMQYCRECLNKLIVDITIYDGE